jgi:hypothetical protein
MVSHTAANFTMKLGQDTSSKEKGSPDISPQDGKAIGPFPENLC